MEPRWYMIVNPAAGHGRGLGHLPRIARTLREEGIATELVFTEHRFHATELAVEAVTRGFRRILVVGGDGTLHETVNGLFIQQAVDPREVLVAVIPTGVRNNCARQFGVPFRYARAAKAIREGHSRALDVGRITYEEAHYRQVRYVLDMKVRGARRFLGRHWRNALPLQLDGERLNGTFVDFTLLPQAIKMISDKL